VSERPSIEEERNAALLSWYADHQRSLPWRGSSDPYVVLVSEMMLQQTQVSRVVDHFERFVALFPTVGDLAAATFTEVLAAWVGLGYNTRAKRLHEAARRIAEEGWPTDAAGLEDLPGVGPYTAAAVASFAFGQQIAAVDTNQRRVLSRWHGEVLSGSGLDAVVQRHLPSDAAAWNQAVMDLGALVCRPHRPACDVCPVVDWCAGPEIYAPPRPQGRFEGSVRHARGTIVRTLVRHPTTFDELSEATGLAPDDLEDVLLGLEDDGLIVVDTPDGTIRIAD
jgi:A/G-specific adenine glycosylase